MFVQTLKTLYSSHSSIREIITILNNSRYITEIQPVAGNPLLFNTGFRFFTHLNTPMDLFYDLNNKEFIRTRESPYPLKPPHLIGFIGSITDSEYIDRVIGQYCLHFNKIKSDLSTSDEVLTGFGFVDYFDSDNVVAKGSDLSAIEILDSDGRRLSSSVFQIIEEEGITQLPLRKTFYDPLYFNGTEFSEYRTRDYDKDDDEDS